MPTQQHNDTLGPRIGFATGVGDAPAIGFGAGEPPENGVPRQKRYLCIRVPTTQFLRDFAPALWSVGLWTFLNICDILTSVANNGNPNVEEGNPFARDAAHHFILRRGLLIKEAYLVALLVFGVAAFKALYSATSNHKLSLFIAFSPFLYMSYELIEVVLANTFFWLKLYTP